MNYSRSEPSERYRYLQTLYREMHEQGERFLGVPAESTFPGFSLDAQLGRIKYLIDATGAQTILDYGCGKGKQYEPRHIKDGKGGGWPSVVDYWDVGEIACYDPCYVPFSALPSGKFDGVISTDVLEHCPAEDMPWIIDEIFGYASKFVFANVACYPARKRLPNGENAHCTVQAGAWWRELFTAAASRHPGIRWEVWIQSRVDGAQGPKLIEEHLGN